ncbi:hypothetical protein [Puerhibacterium puerhi]|uniref:hypothetical protein n=1 Tax=Puerhibacterium puerhi TaxID=2692623 RepID=UPI001357C4D4|nr:hypothetical protein [Puerhibacterium puerhi]
MTQHAAARHRRLALPHVPEMLYGAVVTASVLAVFSAHAPETAGVVVATAAVAVVYWLAHVYVDAVGGRFVDPAHPTHVRLATSLAQNWSVLIGSAPPILVLLLARALGAGAQTAAWVALWFTIAMLVAAGGAAAYRAGARGGALVAEALVAGAFGVLVVLLKYALH